MPSPNLSKRRRTPLQRHSHIFERRGLRRKDPGVMWRDCWRQSARLAVVTVFVLSGVGIAGAQEAPANQGSQAGQTQVPNMPGMRMPNNLGIVSGVVTKASGGPVSGATVVASNASNGTQFSATTDDQGHYSLPSLPVGTYDII